MALVILVLMLYCFLTRAVAGDDALVRRLGEAREQKNDTALVLALADQAYSRWLTSPDVGIQEAQEAIGIAERVAFPRGKAIALVSLGWCHYVRSEYAEAMRAFLQATPAGRPGEPEEVAGLVAFLLSAAASLPRASMYFCATK